MKALQIYAGPRAMAHIRSRGLSPADVRAIPAAAGGPKGLILGALDRYLFGEWLTESSQPIDLIGASIGAWRMATACTPKSVAKFHQLEHDYIHQDYVVEPGKKRPTSTHISERFGSNLRAFYADLVAPVLAHERYRLHIITSRGKGILSRETGLRAGLGFGCAFFANAVSRNSMGMFIERVVFSQAHAKLPFEPDGYPGSQVMLTELNFCDALQASCAIPFALKSVPNITGAPQGAYWDGGLTDYHLHLDWRQSEQSKIIATNPIDPVTKGQFGIKNLGFGVSERPSIVIYPHFQQAVVPGWLDKSWKSRHRATAFLDDLIVLAPTAQWVASLPNAKLPDRSDFTRFGTDLGARVAAWQRAANMSHQLANEFASWLEAPNPDSVLPL